jgi:hypothetical protein
MRGQSPTPAGDDRSQDQNKEDVKYEDFVWLTKKSARAKLEKYRREREGSQEVDKEKPNAEPIKNCATCSHCSTVKTLRMIQYMKCTKGEPTWVLSQDNLSCWKPID